MEFTEWTDAINTRVLERIPDAQISRDADRSASWSYQSRVVTAARLGRDRAELTVSIPTGESDERMRPPSPEAEPRNWTIDSLSAPFVGEFVINKLLSATN